MSKKKTSFHSRAYWHKVFQQCRSDENEIQNERSFWSAQFLITLLWTKIGCFIEFQSSIFIDFGALSVITNGLWIFCFWYISQSSPFKEYLYQHFLGKARKNKSELCMHVASISSSSSISSFNSWCALIWEHLYIQIR